MSTAASVTSRVEGVVAFVALNRPEKRNAISRDVLRAMTDAIVAAERDRAVRAIVLYGEGRVFSAGVDFAMLQGLANASGHLTALQAAVDGNDKAAFDAAVRKLRASLKMFDDAFKERTAVITGTAVS